MPEIPLLFTLVKHALAVPVRRALRPRGTGMPRWSPKYEVLVTALREAFDITAHLSVGERRAALESLTTPSPLTFKVRREHVDVSGVPAVWFTPNHAARAPVILFLHGGAYQFGSVRMYTDIICRIALASRLRVLAIDYRLAPEHPFPAAHEDAMKAYEHLRANASPVVVMGDSAGGNLALSLALNVRAKGLPPPVALVPICPWVELGPAGGSRIDNIEHDTLPDVGDAWAQTYAAGHSLTDPRISPLHADLRGLPPMLVHAGGREVIRDDVRAFVAKAKAAGVSVDYSEYDEMVHDWHMLASFGVPESLRAIDEIGKFARHATGTT
jgi:acetyl esterase/lipase